VAGFAIKSANCFVATGTIRIQQWNAALMWTPQAPASRNNKFHGAVSRGRKHETPPRLRGGGCVC